MLSPSSEVGHFPSLFPFLCDFPNCDTMVSTSLPHWWPSHEDYVEWFQVAQQVFFCAQREISSRVLHDTLGLL